MAMKSGHANWQYFGPLAAPASGMQAGARVSVLPQLVGYELPAKNGV
jgi:hypothetical protein